MRKPTFRARHLVRHRQFGKGVRWTIGDEQFECVDVESVDGELWVYLRVDGEVERRPLVDVVVDMRQEDQTTGYRNVADLEPDDAEWLAIPEHARTKVVTLARHVIEAATGDYWGYPVANLNPPRRPEYDPKITTSLEARLQAKSDELTGDGWEGVSFKSLERHWTSLKRGRLIDLVDKRARPPRNVTKTVDKAVLKLVEDLVPEWRQASHMSRKAKRIVVRSELMKAGLTDPPLSTYRLNQLIDYYTAGFLDGSAQTVRYKESRPTGAHGRWDVTRPGQMLQIDITSGNAWAYDKIVGETKYETLAAVDMFHGAIPAVRTVPYPATSRDLGLLIWDILNPVMKRTGFTSGAERHWTGAPETIVFVGDYDKATNDAADSARTPTARHAVLRNADEPPDTEYVRPIASGEDVLLHGVWPSTVIFDRGPQFNSFHILALCCANGIEVVFARPGRGPDKGLIETVWNDFAEWEQILPGAKGARTSERGTNTEQRALLSVEEIQQYFYEMIHLVRHRRPVEGNRQPSDPAVALSSNEQLAMYLKKSGSYIEWPVPIERAVEFLEKFEARINDDGVHNKNYVYDDPDLWTQARRRRTQGDNGKKETFYFDRDDRSRIYWRDSDTGFIHEILLKHSADKVVLPFTDGYAREVRKYAMHLQKAGLTGDEEELAAAEVRARFTNHIYKDYRQANLVRLAEAKIRSSRLTATTWASIVKAARRDQVHDQNPDMDMPAIAKLAAVSDLDTTPDDDTGTFDDVFGYEDFEEGTA